MYYGYINDSNRDLELKLNKLKESGIKENNIFIENNDNRHKLEEVINMIHEMDTLIIADITDIAQKTGELYRLLKISYEKKVNLIIETFTFDCTKKDVRIEAMLELINILAGFERKVVNRRIRIGVNKAKDRKHIGRPRLTMETLPSIVKELYPLYKNGTIGTSEYAEKCQMSRPRIANYIKFLEGERGESL